MSRMIHGFNALFVVVVAVAVAAPGRFPDVPPGSASPAGPAVAGRERAVDGWGPGAGAGRERDIGAVAEVGAAPAVARPTLEQSVVNGCLACHGRDPLRFDGRTSEELRAAIREMATQTGHPVPIPSLSDEDLKALADALVQPAP